MFYKILNELNLYCVTISREVVEVGYQAHKNKVELAANCLETS